MRIDTSVELIKNYKHLTSTNQNRNISTSAARIFLVSGRKWGWNSIVTAARRTIIMYVYIQSLNLALQFVRLRRMFIFKFDVPQMRYFVLPIYWTVVSTQYPFHPFPYGDKENTSRIVPSGLCYMKFCLFVYLFILIMNVVTQCKHVRSSGALYRETSAYILSPSACSNASCDSCGHCSIHHSALKCFSGNAP